MNGSTFDENSKYPMVVLKKCEITSSVSYYLVSKQYQDFSLGLGSHVRRMLPAAQATYCEIFSSTLCLHLYHVT